MSSPRLEIQELDWLQCVAAISQGSPEWETSLALFFQPRIHMYATRALQGRAAVDDVVQDTLWSAIKALREGRVHEPATLPAFVYSIARHRVMDVHRGEARTRTEPIPNHFDSAALPDLSSAEREKEQLAEKAIAELEPLDREVLNMVLVNGLNHAEIAQRLQVTVAAVRQRKCRALRRVTERLRDYFSPPQSQTQRSERH